MSSQIIRPSRSISYNDIKKRRLLRESKSKSKLKIDQPCTDNLVNRVKITPFFIPHIYETEPSEGNIGEFVSRKILKTKQMKECMKKNHKFSAVNLTDRVRFIVKRHGRNTIDHIDNKESNENNLELKQTTKEFQQCKSYKKQYKFSELMNQFHLYKQKSKSSSQRTLKKQLKIARKKITEIDITPEKPTNYKLLEGVKNSHRVKKIVTVQENQSKVSKTNDNTLLATERTCQFFGKRKKTQLQDNTQSSIEIEEQSKILDEQDTTLLQAMQLKISSNGFENFCMNEELKILDFMNQDRVKDPIKKQNKEIEDAKKLHEEMTKSQKRKKKSQKLCHQLSKLNKKFPKGFFKL